MSKKLFIVLITACAGTMYASDTKTDDTVRSRLTSIIAAVNIEMTEPEHDLIHVSIVDANQFGSRNSFDFCRRCGGHFNESSSSLPRASSSKSRSIDSSRPTSSAPSSQKSISLVSAAISCFNFMSSEDADE